MRKSLAASAATGLATSVAIGAVAAALGGYSIARAVTEPYRGRRFSTPVRAISSHNGQSVVVLDDDEQTRRKGLYGAFLPDGTHVQFGTEALPWGSAVARTIPPEAARRMSEVDHLSWTGIHFPTPESAGLEAENIDLGSDVGVMPAWLISGRSRRQWAIHVHGMGSTRAGTLRGVQVATSLGLTSLVVSYRNSPEGARHRSGRATLGLDEADDVQAALEYAVAHGAERLVLFGWSMGASIALQLAHEHRWHPRIAGIVADSPVIDWRTTIAANLDTLGVPSRCARLSHPWLSRATASRAVGLNRPIDLDALDWTRAGRIRTPMLILQGVDDRSTPWQAASHVADGSTRVDLELFEADHTTSWNSDPQRWRNVVSTWTSDLLGLSSGVAG